MLHSKASKIGYKKKIGLFPGSFNPFHLGHWHILQQAEQVFDELIIFVGQNPNKPTQNFSEIKRQIKQFIAKQTPKKYKIICSNDLTPNVAICNDCSCIIRGIRDCNDLQYEIALRNEYKKINPKIEVVYFLADDLYKNFKSSN